VPLAIGPWANISKWMSNPNLIEQPENRDPGKGNTTESDLSLFPSESVLQALREGAEAMWRFHYLD
jgi:hypothetical protein